MRALVTGANRGIGLELVRQLLRRGDSVDAVAREPDRARELRALRVEHGHRLQLLACDVTSDLSIRAMARARGLTALDLLINNAGVMGTSQGVERQPASELVEVFDVNAAGPFRVTQALLPALEAGAGKKIVHLSSTMGSISGNRSGGYYAYRMSKAALNMLSTTLAEELRKHGILSVVMNPGWVQTEMGGHGAPVRVEDSAAGLLRVIDRLTLQDSGKFLDYLEGAEIPW
jgi:NAD(P)-dependent dehydrogenase (short-subunit alcohol dehydrogenase family)